MGFRKRGAKPGATPLFLGIAKRVDRVKNPRPGKPEIEKFLGGRQPGRSGFTEARKGDKELSQDSTQTAVDLLAIFAALWKRLGPAVQDDFF